MTHRAFRQLLVNEELEVSAANDNCLRVRIQGLKPRRRYDYRFLVPERGLLRSSRMGLMKTAPEPDADVPVRFASANCQDHIGRYYNSYLNLLRRENRDLDFVVHLGDYTYETTGDPSFQTPTEERSIDFEDKAGGIERTAADGQTFYAAASGNIDLTYANLLLEGAGVPLRIDVTGREKGISYLLLGKQRLFDFVGVRDLVIKDTFDLLAQITSSTGREDVLGAAQQPGAAGQPARERCHLEGNCQLGVLYVHGA